MFGIFPGSSRDKQKSIIVFVSRLREICAGKERGIHEKTHLFDSDSSVDFAITAQNVGYWDSHLVHRVQLTTQ